VTQDLPHWGYIDCETPTYAECTCGLPVRTDRLDLLSEHAVACAAEPSLARDVLASLRADVERRGR
jgi:hypothetical protein